MRNAGVHQGLQDDGCARGQDNADPVLAHVYHYADKINKPMIIAVGCGGGGNLAPVFERYAQKSGARFMALDLNDVMSLELPEELKADVTLSMGVAMSVPFDQLKNYTKSLLGNTKPGGHIVHLHSAFVPKSLEADDPHFSGSYYRHSSDKMKRFFRQAGGVVKSLPSISDPTGRYYQFSVLDIEVPK